MKRQQRPSGTSPINTVEGRGQFLGKHNTDLSRGQERRSRGKGEVNSWGSCDFYPCSVPLLCPCCPLTLVQIGYFPQSFKVPRVG